MTTFTGLVVIVPTRNRAELAAAAVQSVLDARCSDVRVLISDNSTDPGEIDRLAATCEGLGIDRLRPPEPMPMAAHWEWALERTLENTEASHIAFLTDRMIFECGALAALVALARRYPDDVVSYGHDLLDDSTRPVRLEQAPWTGRILRIPVALLVELISRSMQWATEPVLPRLLNCVVPRPVVSGMRLTFGAASGRAIAPDYAFAFRCLATVNSILHYDRSALLPYALDRSNGTSQVLGRVSADHSDFLANLDGRGMNFAAPIPGLPTALSSILHEYATVREQGIPWPAVDWDRYLSAVREEAALMDHGQTKRDTLLALERFSNHPQLASRPARRLARALRLASAPRLAFTLAWMKAGRRSGLWRPVERWTGLGAPDLSPRVTMWGTREEALAYARQSPRRPQPGISALEFAAQKEFGRVSIKTVATMRT